MQRPVTACGHRAFFDGEAPEHLAWGPTAALWVIGCLSLAAGVLVYLSDRSASHALWVPAVTSLSGQHLFGVIGQWLPNFVHPLAFSLFSVALMAPRPGWRYSACAFWFGVNAAFEIGQHPQVRRSLVDALRHGLGQGQVELTLENYFLRGTFDVGDLVAALLGAAAAAGMLRGLAVRQETHHVP